MVDKIRKFFSPGPDLSFLSALVTDSEKGQRGEIAVIIRDKAPLFSKKTTREEALELFSLNRIWDTEENLGILIFICLSKRAIEIVVDRGISKNIPDPIWSEICRQTAGIFSSGKDYKAGAEYAVKRVGEELKKAFPGQKQTNELSDLISRI